MLFLPTTPAQFWNAVANGTGELNGVKVEPIDFPVTPKPAFYEWAAQVRRETPYILGTNRWHIDADKARPLCNTRPYIRRRGNYDDITASHIPVCRTCQRIANAELGEPVDGTDVHAW